MAQGTDVNDWYHVLGVSSGASQDEIAAAFARLAPEERDPHETDDDAEERRLREYAYGVLSDPGRRAAYDSEREAAAGASQRTLATAGAASGGRRGIPLGPIVGVLGLVFAVAAVAMVALLLRDDDDGSDYPNREDGDYDLEAMRLRNADLPSGFAFSDSLEFSNEEWSQLFFSEEEQSDPEGIQEDLQAKIRELEAEGRLRNLLSVYQSEELGRTLGIFSISTLYTDDAAASASLGLFCGLPVDQRRGLESRPIDLPEVGQQSSGFIAEGVMSSPVYRETTFCFRTGRVVHAISLASLPGIEDISLAVRLAHRMEDRVDAFYDGKEPPADDEDSEDSDEGADAEPTRGS